MNTLNYLIKHWAFLSESEENFTSENIFRKESFKKPLNKKIINEQVNSILLEGGNAIKDAVRINQENVAPTLEEIYTKLLPEIGIKKEDTAVLGSTGKKLPGGSSGDIDLAIDISKISNYDFKIWSANIESTLTDLGIEFKTFPGISLLSVKWPISNKDGKQANEFVQLDLMPTEDIEFSVFSKYSETEQEGTPFYKSLIRNAIMISLSQCLPVKIFAKGKLAIDPDGEDHPVDYEKFSYDFNKGLFLKHKIRKPRKDGTYNKTIVTLEKTLITKNPNEIIKKLFGPGYSPKDVETVMGTWNLAQKSPLLVDEETKQIFYNSLKNYLEPLVEKNHLVVPSEIAKTIGLTVSEAKRPDDSDVDTHREPLTKIHQLKGTPLRKFITDFKNGLDSSSFEIELTPKIDGHPFRVAWIDNNVYLETSYSGLMGREELAGQKLPKFEQRFFDYIEKQNSKPLFDEIKKYGLTGIKIIGELLSNGEEFADGNIITYVGTSYDATKLGKYGSFVILDIKGATLTELTDLPESTYEKIKAFLVSKFSNKDVSYFDINQFAQKIPLSKEDFSKEFISQIDSIESVSKLKPADAENIKMMINAELTDIFKKKFKNPSIMPEGDKSLEGVAFKLNGNLYGIHYQSWKDIRTSYYKDIDEIKDFEHKFLANMVGVSETTKFGTIISEIRNNIEKYQEIWKKSYKKFIERRKELVDKLMNDTSLPKFVRYVGQGRAQNLLSKFKDEEITSDINSLLDIISPITNGEGKTICIIPGSFRPPHKGHFAMIEHYSKIADEVIVAISGQATISSRRPDKFGRTMPNYVAGQILKLYCKAYNLTNVKIVLTMKLMQWLTWRLNTLENAKIILGVSSKDDVSRFSAFTNERFKKSHPTLEILPIEDYQPKSTKTDSGEDVSATFVRQNIDNKDEIRKIVPDKLSDAEFEKVFDLMNPPDGEYPPMVNKNAADSLSMSESKNQLSKSKKVFQKVQNLSSKIINEANENSEITDYNEFIKKIFKEKFTYDQLFQLFKDKLKTNSDLNSLPVEYKCRRENSRHIREVVRIILNASKDTNNPNNINFYTYAKTAIDELNGIEFNNVSLGKNNNFLFNIKVLSVDEPSVNKGFSSDSFDSSKIGLSLEILENNKKVFETDSNNLEYVFICINPGNRGKTLTPNKILNSSSLDKIMTAEEIINDISNETLASLLTNINTYTTVDNEAALVLRSLCENDFSQINKNEIRFEVEKNPELTTLLEKMSQNSNFNDVLINFSEVFGAVALSRAFSLATKNPFFIKFPKNANESLIDYFVLDNKDDLFKVSAKVDAGAKPSITNILRNIDEFLSTDSGKEFIKKLQQNNKLDSAAIDSVKWLIASIRKPTVLKSFANIAECMRKILEGNTENYEWANLLFKKFNLSEEDKQILNISLDVNDPANNSLEFQKVEDIIKLVNKIAGKPIASKVKKDDFEDGSGKYKISCIIKPLVNLFVLYYNESRGIDIFNELFRKSSGGLLQIHLIDKNSVKKGQLKFKLVIVSEASTTKYKFVSDCGNHKVKGLYIKRLSLKLVP